MDAWSTLYRQRIMLREYVIALLIQQASQKYAPVILDDPTSVQDPQDWLVRLCLSIKQFVLTRTKINLNACKFLPGFENSSILFSEADADFKKRRMTSSNQAHIVTCDYVARVLQHWLSMPIPFISQAQMLFVQTLVATAGTGALLMPHVWTLYSTLPSWIFSSNCPRVLNRPSNQNVVFQETFMEEFCTMITTSPELHSARKDLDQLQAEFRRLHEGTSKHVEALIISRSKRRYLGQIASQVQAHHVPQASSSTSAVQSTPFLPVPAGSSSSSAAPSTTGLKCQKVVEFLRDARALVTSTTTLSRAQRLLQQNSDFLMPLRESSSSRIVVNLKMNKAYAQTPAGLFSLLVHRGISYNTESFRSAPAEMHPVSHVSTFSNTDQ